MSKIKFSDGVEFDTNGEYRVVHRKDGYYVVGQGFLCPVASYDEGMKLVEDFKGGSHGNHVP
jgi:hypothetical protein